MEAPVLKIKDLRTYFRIDGGIAKAVDGISFDVFPGEVLGIVGESGSGKSVTALSMLRLVPDPPGFIAGGEVMLGDRDLLKLNHAEMRQVRGRDIGMVFQEPMTSLNPVFTIGMQVMEPLIVHERISRGEAFERAVEMLRRVGIPDADQRMKDYPHQFSGGMRQRVMIAISLICHPPLLIADEPTTALDVTTQAQILDLMIELKQKHEAGSIILITHDLGVVAKTCDRMVVMYGGKVQETGTVRQVFYEPRHPYTQGLLSSIPSRGGKKHHRLKTIPGNVPMIMDLPGGCKFSTRCGQVFDHCIEEEPLLRVLNSGRLVRCHLVETVFAPKNEKK